MNKTFIAAVATGVLVLAGCGDDDSGSDSTGPAQTVPPVDDSTATADEQVTTEPDASSDTTPATEPAATDSGGDDHSAGGLSDLQQAAADQAVDEAASLGFELDRSCVENLAAQLTEDDARIIIETGPEGDADLSPRGEALSDGLMTCADSDDLVDLFIQEIEKAGQPLDDECVRAALDGMDLTELDENDGPPEEIVEAIMGCVEL